MRTRTFPLKDAEDKRNEANLLNETIYRMACGVLFLHDVSRHSVLHMKAFRCLPLFLCMVSPTLALDQNTNQQSDVWEMIFAAPGLSAAGDADGDGWSNATESAAGTNPLDSNSFPGLAIAPNGAASLLVSWAGLAGKKYSLLSRADLTEGTWTPAAPDMVGAGAPAQAAISINGAPRGFFQLSIGDQDTDGDGVNDWEESAIGFDTTRTRTDRSSQTDSQRVAAGLSAANTITVSSYDDTISERWPDPGVVVVRRTGGLQPLTVNIVFGGDAARGVDYSVPFAGNAVTFAPGQREVFVEVTPLADANDGETTETITLTALAGTGYTVDAQNAATISLLNETNASGPSAKAAARFLIQAAFGPDQDSAGDADQIPENVEQVMALGFDAWIDDQFARPIGTLTPFVQWAAAQPGSAQIYNDTKQDAWWGRAMGLRKLRPDAVTEQDPDPLRQRVAFALSQIFVISDRMEALATNRLGMTNYYDMLVTGAFGNYRDLLFNVATHPCMGLYLSHLGNAKANSGANTFPDENFAREIMQLFSIGLWRLEPNGLRKLSDGTDLDPLGNVVPVGEPIPTYGNANITEFARVFTGLSHWNSGFNGYSDNFTQPMIGWDAFHDLGPKTLLLGATTPARTASSGSTGTATFVDVNAAVDNLFNHPNVGPFVARLLIQRFVTSNPSSAYIGRVAAKFDNNGSSVRGDMKAVVKAILLDEEARDPARRSDITFGKLREPFLKCVNFARAFNASTASGWYYLDAFTLDHVQEPMKSPSVFNFFLPNYTPPGALAQAGLAAPEFQIVNAASGVTAPNYFWNSIDGGLHRWGTGTAAYETTLNLTPELLLITPNYTPGDDTPPGPALDPDPLLRRLDLALAGGTLTPRNFQIIREAMLRIPVSTFDWANRRIRLGIYLIVTSPEFAVQR